MLFRGNSGADVIRAVEKALAANVSSSEAVIHILRNGQEKAAPHIKPLENWLRLPPADVSIYDQIGGDL
jgi:hypothetical protein